MIAIIAVVVVIITRNKEFLGAINILLQMEYSPVALLNKEIYDYKLDAYLLFH